MSVDTNLAKELRYTISALKTVAIPTPLRYNKSHWEVGKWARKKS